MSDEVKKAMDAIKKAIKDDPAYAYGWHSNIAMACYDAIRREVPLEHGPSLNIGNDAASNFMKLCFDAETSKDMLKDSSNDSEISMP